MEVHGGRVQSQQLKSKRPTGLFWYEKIWLLIDWLQLFSIYWQAANPWPWPYLWVQYNRWTVASNLDYFSLSPTGALNGSSGTIDLSSWGEMPHYLFYAVAFALPMFLLIVVYYTYLDPVYFQKYGVNRLDQKPVFLKYALTAGHLLYLPVCLAVFRLYYCNPDTGRLACDPTVVCNSSPHLIAVGLATVFMLPLAIGLPVATFQYIQNSLIFNLPSDHEKRLQMWEITYQLDIDNVFAERQLWLTSSFKRPFAYLRFELLLMKMAALVVFIFVRRDFNLQGGLLWLIYAQFGARYMFTYPYRNLSTNAMFKVLCALMLADVTFGLMNASGAQSAMLVASTETLWLLAINCSGALLLLAVVLISMLNPYAVAPADTTLSGINRNASNAMIKAYTRWVCCLHNYHRFRRNWYAGTRLNADIIGMEDLIQTLRHHWLLARGKGSLFETPLSDALEDILIMRSFAPKGDENGFTSGGPIGAPVGASLRRRECWNKTMEEPSDDPSARLLPHAQDGELRNHFNSPSPYNAANPRTFAKTVRRRSEMYILMNPKKKRIMQKLLALKALMGKRDLAHFDRKGLSAAEAEHNWILNEEAKMRDHEEAVLSAHNRIPNMITESNMILSRTKEILKRNAELIEKMSGLTDAAQMSDQRAVLKAHLEEVDQCQLGVMDLVAEWTDAIGTYEARNIDAVGTKAAVAAKNAAMRADAVLAKHGKVAYSAEEQEEWYTYRMVLNDKLILLNEVSQLATEEGWNDEAEEEDIQFLKDDLEDIWSAPGGDGGEIGLSAPVASDIIIPGDDALGSLEQQPVLKSPLVSKLDISSLLRKNDLQFTTGLTDAQMELELDALDALHDDTHEDLEAAWGDEGEGAGEEEGAAAVDSARLMQLDVELTPGRAAGRANAEVAAEDDVGDVGNWGDNDDGDVEEDGVARDGNI